MSHSFVGTVALFPTRHDRAATLLTIARAPVGVAVIVAIWMGAHTLALLLLIGFVVMDVADGGAARRHGNPDDPDRRALDSVIDRSTVAGALLAAGVVDQRFVLIGLASLLVSCWGLVAAAGTYANQGAVLKAPVWHRAWSLTYFLAGAFLLIGQVAIALALAAAATGVLLICTVALIQEHRVRAVAVSG